MANSLDDSTRDLFFLHCIRVTDDKRREILIDRVLLGRTAQSVADTMGLSRQRVQELEADAKRILLGAVAA